MKCSEKQKKNVTTLSLAPESSVEIEKLDIERQKLLLETEKIRLERLKTVCAGLSAAVPALAVVFGIWSFQQQSKLQMELQLQQSKAQFELKAVEVILNTQRPTEAKAKAKALANFFPNYLPLNFADSFNVDEYTQYDINTESNTKSIPAEKFKLKHRSNKKSAQQQVEPVGVVLSQEERKLRNLELQQLRREAEWSRREEEPRRMQTIVSEEREAMKTRKQ